MHWPHIEFPEIKHDAWHKNKRTGRVEYLWTLATQQRQYGRQVMQTLMQELPENFEEGPRREPGK
jgi:hypothetical protein